MYMSEKERFVNKYWNAERVGSGEYMGAKQ